jgi:3-phenylpropionate/trans-cinnamate dioxygenase ferredoxin reductase subunit
VMLARAAGLELGESGGIRCDAGLRTSADGIWAAGDVCEYDSVLHGRRARVEHWDVAVEQGKHVARAMQGAAEPYAVVPYFFSDLADWASLEYVGIGGAWETEEVRGSLEDGAFSITYADAAGRVTGALSVGRGEDLEEAKRRIRERADLDSGR